MYDFVCFLQEAIQALWGEGLLGDGRRIVLFEGLVENGREICHRGI